jgi:hypothetical protein
MTVRPDTTIVRPDVRAAVAIAWCRSAPPARSSRWRRRKNSEDEGDRQRGLRCLTEVAVDLVVHRLPEAGVTGLGYQQVRVSGLDLGHRVQGGSNGGGHIRGGPGDVEGDQRAAAISGDQRRADTGRRARPPGQRFGNLADGLPHRGIGREGGTTSPFGYKHCLSRRGCHAQVLQRLLGLPRLAEVVLLLAGGT